MKNIILIYETKSYTQIKEFLLNNIRYYIIEIFKIIVQKIYWKKNEIYTIITIFKHTKNVNFRRFWKASDIKNYETIDEVMWVYFMIKMFEVFKNLR